MNEEKNISNNDTENSSPSDCDETRNNEDMPKEARAITVIGNTEESEPKMKEAATAEEDEADEANEADASEVNEDCEEDEEDSRKLGKFLKAAAFLSFALALASGILRFCFSKNAWAAEAFYRYVSRYLQAVAAKATSILPFSLAETIIILLPFVIITVLVLSVYHLVKRDTYKLKCTVVCIFTAVCLVFSNFMLNLSILYCRPSLSELSGLDESGISSDELCASSVYVIHKLGECVDSGAFRYDISGASVNPYGYEELDRRIEAAFDKFAEANKWVSPFGAKSKIIALSDLMTYTHISGIYTQYTGEANINVNYPDHIVCATMAHEKAHQRGIAPEDEANLVAFFVLAESGDPYLEYCGYMSIFSDLTTDCYKAAPEYYVYNIAPLVPKEVNNDFEAYARFFEKYTESEAAQVADTANNAYLRLNGEEHGVESYHMTSGLVAKYIMGRIDKEFYEE